MTFLAISTAVLAVSVAQNDISDAHPRTERISELLPISFALSGEPIVAIRPDGHRLPDQASTPSAEDVGPRSSAENADKQEPYGVTVFMRESKSIPWRLGGAAAAITVTGIANWDWGTSDFHVKSEGWFGEETANGGMDKLGHAYTGYVLTEFFADGVERKSRGRRSPPYTAAILAMGLMTYIEVFDGLSEDHGFSFEDLAVDAAGVLFALGRRSVPGLRDKLDFRLLYTPTEETIDALSCLPRPHCERDGATARTPITDYSSQRYLLALKLSGFSSLRHTPLRLVELHAGYYARGFTKEEQILGESRRRKPFIGMGLNVSELLLRNNKSGFGRFAKSVLQYLQVPYTAVHFD